MLDRIRTALADVEAAEDVRILLAVESGSRAWGFPSRDSDWDVRFLYVRPLAWYLSIDAPDRPDTLEYPVSDLLDLSGWDLRKALRLLRKSNPPLLEWLRSPIVYREVPPLAGRLREAAGAFFSPAACFHHYLHMARGNFREYLGGPMVRRKKYFYVLRPLLAMAWLEREAGPVPMEFERLVDALVPAGALRDAIDALLRDKRAGVEMDAGPRIDVLSDFLDAEMARLEAAAPPPPPVPQDARVLDDLLLAAIAGTWGETVARVDPGAPPRPGQVVELDGLLAAVVGTDADAGVPEGHVALWFGDPPCVRRSQGGPGGARPEVWTVPADLCAPAAAPDVRH